MQEKTFALSRRALLRTAAVGAAATAATATIPSVVMAADGVAADTSKIRNFDMIEAFYREYPKKLAVVRGTLNRPLTLTEKILFTHLYHPESLREFKRGVDYIELRPDRAGTHDIGGPMAIIQFSPRARNASHCPQRSSATTSFRPTSAPFPTSRSPKRATSKRTSSCATSPAATALTSGPPAPASAIRSSWKTTTSRVA